MKDPYVARMQATMFKALGEPTRLQIVELLRDGPRSVGEIVDELALAQPQVSKHLRVLNGSGIVGVHPVAKLRIYHLEATPFEQIGDWIDSFERSWDLRLDSLDRYLSSVTKAGTHGNERNAP